MLPVILIFLIKIEISLIKFFKTLEDNYFVCPRCLKSYCVNKLNYYVAMHQQQARTKGPPSKSSKFDLSLISL